MAVLIGVSKSGPPRPENYHVGAAVSQANRNLGMALEVALVVSFVAIGTGDLSRFDRAWLHQVVGELASRLTNAR